MSDDRETEPSPRSEPRWWEGYFDEDYIELYAPLLPPEHSRMEAETVYEMLALRPGARVLDLGCGWGRHSVELARLGCSVVGLDQSPVPLERAAALADEAGVVVEWVRGDVRERRWNAEFDVVVSLFSSLGYSGGDEDDVLALRAARAALVPEGSFVLETMHRDPLARGYTERDWWPGASGEPVWVEREFDAVEGVSREWLRWLRDGQPREKYHEIRIRAAPEWAALLERAGLDPLAWYGSWELDPFDLRSDRLIVVAGAGDGDVSSPPRETL